MNLFELAKGIEGDMRLLNDEGRMNRELLEYVDLSTEFESLGSDLAQAANDLAVLRAAGIRCEVETAPPAAVAAIRSIMSSETTVVDQPQQRSKVAVRDLKRWTAEVRRLTMERYQNWVDGIMPDLTGVEALGVALAPFDATLSVRIRGGVARANALRRVLPASAALFDEAAKISKELKGLSEEVAPTEETRHFLDAILAEGGATLEQLTPQVEDWAKGRGFWSKLRVRFSEDHED